jgi:peptidyl-prolyl cis-trans isomerase SurA
MSEEARSQLRDKLLQTIIENRIQLQQAEREKIIVDDVEIQEQLAEIMKKVKASTPQQFEELLAQQGLSLDAAKRRIRDQILVQRLIRRKVALRISVTEQEIDRYLMDNREKLEAGLTFHARHMLFAPGAGRDEAAWEDARRKAEQAHALVREGQDFAAVARQSSEDPSAKDGGDLGTLKRGELTPEIEQAILQLTRARRRSRSARRSATICSTSTRRRRCRARRSPRRAARSATSSTARSTRAGCASG